VGVADAGCVFRWSSLISNGAGGGARPPPRTRYTCVRGAWLRAQSSTPRRRRRARGTRRRRARTTRRPRRPHRPRRLRARQHYVSWSSRPASAAAITRCAARARCSTRAAATTSPTRSCTRRTTKRPKLPCTTAGSRRRRARRASRRLRTPSCATFATMTGTRASAPRSDAWTSSCVASCAAVVRRAARPALRVLTPHPPSPTAVQVELQGGRAEGAARYRALSSRSLARRQAVVADGPRRRVRLRSPPRRQLR